MGYDPTSAPSPARSERIYAQQVRMLYESAPISQAGTLLVAAILAWSEWGKSDHLMILVWLLSLTTIAIGRLLLTLAYRGAQAGQLEKAGMWSLLFVGCAALAGAAWGCAGIYLLPLPDLVSHLMVIFALGGMAASGVGYLAPVASAYIAFSAPMLLPVIVRLLLQSDPTLFKMGIVSVAYLVVMTFLAWRTHRTIKTILTLQHQNEDLVEHLESSNAKLSAEVLDRKTAQRTLGESVSVLQATLDATAEGILVLDFAGQLVSYNRRFLDMWKVPEELLDSKRAEILLHHLANQLREPEVFLARVRELYRTKSEEPRVRLEFNDGKIFERLSVPYSVDGAAVGRVWTFQVATERRGSTRV